MVDVRIDVPDDEDELRALMESAWALAVTRFGSAPPDKEVEKIFLRLLFERSNGDE